MIKLEATLQINEGVIPELKQMFVEKLKSLGAKAVQEIKDSIQPSMFPSSPGEPPKEKSGELKESIKYEVVDEELNIYSEADYAGYLEFGTSKMRPRPFMAPVIERLASSFEEEVKKQ